jgi:pyrroline-5-carboxylate reductase
MRREFTLAVIGVGKMGGALVRGVVRAKALAPPQIVVSDGEPGRAQALADEVGVKAATNNSEAASRSEFVVLAVKPAVISSVVAEIADRLAGDQTLVSLAAGMTISQLKRPLGEQGPAVVRVMPNTPALVGEGMFAVAAPGVSGERVEVLTRLLSALGRVVMADEAMLDAVTGLSGSGPAFVFMMIEAMADAGVATGLPRALAQELAAQTVAGAGRMVLETGEHPAALKDAVASPGGTTIAGLAELESGGFRGAVIAAVKAAARRAREMSEGR